jgi:hypothetical protein
MKTLLDLVDHYAQEKVDGVRGWDLLGVGNISWSKWRNSKTEMPVKHYKTICSELGIALTDDHKELCIRLVEGIYVR